eukprot:TRINITY_DN15421_c0_g1_i1.p1 TRINITY_DN15421_c0_g1~~TRINITY_DN15421_c0_g1_i1.p1  ORF type:complete len:358 (-),score=80.85 TRINITY_DN15421_c0_g1_i1:35-1108(-)
MKGLKTLLLLLSLYLCLQTTKATHGQKWKIFGKTFEIESVWTEDALNAEMSANVHLLRSDIIKRHKGVKIKLLADAEDEKGKKITVDLSVFDRNLKTFVDQPESEQQLLPATVGETSIIKMSEFWGAQNYGPILFYFHDGIENNEIESKILIVISGGKQKTREKMKERLKSGLAWIKSLQNFEPEDSDLSPASDGSGASFEKKEENIKEEPETYSPQSQFPHHVGFNDANPNDPHFDWFADTNYMCPNAPIKFMDLLQQDWFTMMDPPDSTQSDQRNHIKREHVDEYEPTRLEHRPPNKRLKLEQPQVQDTSGNDDQAPSASQANAELTDELLEIDEEFLLELEKEMSEVPHKKLTL